MQTTAKKMPRTPEGGRGETHTAAGVSAGLSAAVCIGVQRQYARRDSGNFNRYLDDDILGRALRPTPLGMQSNERVALRPADFRYFFAQQLGYCAVGNPYFSGYRRLSHAGGLDLCNQFWPMHMRPKCSSSRIITFAISKRNSANMYT